MRSLIMEPSPVLPPSPGVAQTTDGTALASLILGILGFLGLGPLGWIPGIICGHMALGRIRRDPSLAGEGMARGGLATSYIGMALTILAVICFVLFFAFFVSATVPHPTGAITP